MELSYLGSYSVGTCKEAQPSRGHSSNGEGVASIHSTLQGVVDLGSSPVVGPDSSCLLEGNIHIAKEVEGSCASNLAHSSKEDSTAEAKEPVEAVTAALDMEASVAMVKPSRNY